MNQIVIRVESNQWSLASGTIPGLRPGDALEPKLVVDFCECYQIREASILFKQEGQPDLQVDIIPTLVIHPCLNFAQLGFIQAKVKALGAKRALALYHTESPVDVYGQSFTYLHYGLKPPSTTSPENTPKQKITKAQRSKKNRKNVPA